MEKTLKVVGELKKRGIILDYVIEGVPVRFIPVYYDLVREAVGTAREVKYGGTRTKVLGREFLVAVMLQTYRPKDKERLARIHEESKPDGRKLLGILKRHGLIDRYREFLEKNLGKT